MYIISHWGSVSEIMGQMGQMALGWGTHVSTVIYDHLRLPWSAMAIMESVVIFIDIYAHGPRADGRVGMVIGRFT